jgi:hypothetical protein
MSVRAREVRLVNALLMLILQSAGLSLSFVPVDWVLS